jgi:hypothetical protein
MVVEDTHRNGKHRTAVPLVNRLDGSLVAFAESIEHFAIHLWNCARPRTMCEADA